jgi:hypothetical protein
LLASRTGDRTAERGVERGQDRPEPRGGRGDRDPRRAVMACLPRSAARGDGVLAAISGAR